jgi:hypothetical protein|eukprot:COSAG01_NODE_1146_length_11522_cov_103.027916_4_plen_281_part_00
MLVDPPLLDEIACHAERIRRDGFTIIDNVIPAEVVVPLRTRVEAAQRASAAAGAALPQLLARGAAVEAAADGKPVPRELARSVLSGMGLLPDRVTGSSGHSCSVEHRSALLDQAAEELAAAGVRTVYPPGTPTGAADNPGVNDITYIPELAPYLANERVVGVAKALLDIDVRIAQTEINKSIPPTPSSRRHAKPGSTHHFGPGVQDVRHWHSDWPHDIGAGTHSGHVSQPFPDACLALSTVWYFCDVSAANGATMVVPGSHKDLRNPRGADDGASVCLAT